ncbi:MAG: hypothetical protein ACKVY0_29015 [Prosthecobacter sp.]|uniref:hypothetical protein n=1 Tax=Prosthecobacter sp. TaxID=1965333 RepID=UPI0039009596
MQPLELPQKSLFLHPLSLPSPQCPLVLALRSLFAGLRSLGGGLLPLFWLLLPLQSGVKPQQRQEKRLHDEKKRLQRVKKRPAWAHEDAAMYFTGARRRCGAVAFA